MDSPEISIAQTLAGRLGLTPPVDVLTVLKKYADVESRMIPEIGVDGICLNLKVPGKVPRVIVHAGNPPTRKNFTLAHELGHIVIPWHIGSIIDNIDEVAGVENIDYWVMEREANAFAAELLMPSPWVRSVLAQENDLAQAHCLVFDTCRVSPVAAARQLAKQIGPGVVYAAVKDEIIQFSGRSEGTIASSLGWGTSWDGNAYGYASAHFEVKYRGSDLHWWSLPAEMKLEASDARSWKELLDEILDDIYDDPKARSAARNRINGVVAYAHGSCKNSARHTQENVSSAAFQRFSGNDSYRAFFSHPKFRSFLKNRVASFFDGSG